MILNCNHWFTPYFIYFWHQISLLSFVFNLIIKKKQFLMCLFSSFLSTASYCYLFSFCLRVFFLEHIFIKRKNQQKNPKHTRHPNLQFCLNTKPTSYYLHCYSSWQTEPHYCKHLLWVSSEVKLQKQPFWSHDDKHTLCSSKQKDREPHLSVTLPPYRSDIQNLPRNWGWRTAPCLNFLFLWVLASVYWTGCSLMVLPDIQLT